MRRLLVASALALSAAAVAVPAMAKEAAAVAPADAPPPRLVVAVSVDQFSADLFAQYRQFYTQGLARLLQGAVFPSAFQSHAATETCPGHSTLLTGAHPSRNGIIANNWFNLSLPRADKRVYCAEDESDPASTSRDPVVSAVHLKVPTLGELMKQANPASRNVAVSAKDRAVMMMGGNKIDAAYWWKGASFTTLKGRTLSPAVEAQNAVIAKQLKAGFPALPLPAWCGAADRSIAVGKGAVGQGRFAMPKDAPEKARGDMFRISPRMDAATVDLANRLVDEMKLGQGAASDVLSVSLSATDYIGHGTGSEGAEMCIQMAQIDAALGKLLAHLDKRKIDYAVVLSADHGGLDLPERLEQQALPRAVRVDDALSPGPLAKAVSARTGITVDKGPLLASDGGDVWVSPALAPDQRAKVIDTVVQIARAHPQVVAVFTAADLAATPSPTGNPQDWSLKERARASFHPGRSGDLVILLDRAITPIPEPIAGMYVATHGSAFDYDRRVPLLFWRKGLTRFEQPAPVETVDIAPTLAALLRLKVADGQFDGRCLDIDGGAGNTCAAK